MRPGTSLTNVVRLAWLCLFPMLCRAQDPIAWWKLDGGIKVLESVSMIQDTVLGHFKYVEGVFGSCIKFDEFTTVIRRPSNHAPQLNPGSFTIEAWVAPRAYPWNWCPIVMQKDSTRGYFFGIDADGRFGLHVSINGQWIECNSRSSLPGLEPQHTWNSDDRAWRRTVETPDPPEPLTHKADPVVPLLKWSHLAGVFDGRQGLILYLNGRPEGRVPIQGIFTPAGESDLYIGRSPEKLRPAHTERPRFTLPIHYSFDGLMDEIRIHGRALHPEEVRKAFKRVQPKTAQPLEFRKIPTGPEGPGRFGAYCTRLNYDEEYDRPWRVGETVDVIVRFDEYPFRLVYWHGINLYPVWYSENGIGLMHEAVETTGPLGCQEALMDRQCRYSQVSILENNDARVVVKWRHALSNILYQLAHVDSATGWGDWCEDIFTVYPDGIAARNLKLWCSQLDKWHSFEQDNFILQPGIWPPDILEKEASTLANLKGEETRLSWEKNGWPEGRFVTDPVIQTYNIKAKSKPFMIVYPGVGEPALEGNSMPWPWCFYWWNHWPVAQIPSDGAQVFTVDGRPSSTCITGTQFKTDAPLNRRTRNSVSQFMLFGMTMDQTAGQLAPLARSWAQAPAIETAGADFFSEGYSIPERCYVLRRTHPVNFASLEFAIQASPESPAVNPAFVIKNWGDADAVLRINGNPVRRGKVFRFGHRETLEGSDLIVWLKFESNEPVRIHLTPVRPAVHSSILIKKE